MPGTKGQRPNTYFLFYHSGRPKVTQPMKLQTSKLRLTFKRKHEANTTSLANQTKPNHTKSNKTQSLN